MRLIDADALIELLAIAIITMEGMTKSIGAEDDPEIKMEIKAYTDILEGVKEQPTIEPERKVGKWIQKGLKWECDQCGCRIRRAKPFSGNMWNYYYCPNCGVKMEEGEQDGQTN